MAITILSAPNTTASPTPCYNEQWLVASSTQTAQPNFTYTLIVKDNITGNTWTEQIVPNPAGKLVVDLSTYSEKYMANYLPVNLYGWKKCADAIRKMTYNVGETYDSGGPPAVPTYFAGTDYSYIVWNAGLDNGNFAPYNVNAYCYDDTVPTSVYLTKVGTTDKTYADRSNYLYAICAEGGTTNLPALEIKTYNNAGTLLGTSNIARPSFATGIYTDSYQCIDIGYKGLLGIAGGLVTGTYPIITASVASYTVKDTNATTPQIIKTITIDCSPKFEVYSLQYLNQKGGYETLHCNLAATLSSTKTTTTFKKSGWSLISNVMTLDPALMTEKIQGVTIQDNLILNSDWLTDAEFVLHKDLFTSTDVRLDVGSTTTYKGVKVTQTGYTTKVNKKMRNYVIELSYTHTNHRQRG